MMFGCELRFSALVITTSIVGQYKQMLQSSHIVIFIYGHNVGITVHSRSSQSHVCYKPKHSYTVMSINGNVDYIYMQMTIWLECSTCHLFTHNTWHYNSVTEHKRGQKQPRQNHLLKLRCMAVRWRLVIVKLAANKLKSTEEYDESVIHETHSEI